MRCGLLVIMLATSCKGWVIRWGHLCPHAPTRRRPHSFSSVAAGISKAMEAPQSSPPQDTLPPPATTPTGVPPAPSERVVLPASTWRPMAEAHRDRIQTLAGGSLHPGDLDLNHPIFNFLFKCKMGPPLRPPRQSFLRQPPSPPRTPPALHRIQITFGSRPRWRSSRPARV